MTSTDAAGDFRTRSLRVVNSYKLEKPFVLTGCSPVDCGSCLLEDGSYWNLSVCGNDYCDTKPLHMIEIDNEDSIFI